MCMGSSPSVPATPEVQAAPREQDAAVVMFLYRDEYYNPDSEKKNLAEVIVAKQRNGATGSVELVWLGQYTKFANKERVM